MNIYDNEIALEVAEYWSSEILGKPINISWMLESSGASEEKIETYRKSSTRKHLPEKELEKLYSNYAKVDPKAVIKDYKNKAESHSSHNSTFTAELKKFEKVLAQLSSEIEGENNENKLGFLMAYKQRLQEKIYSLNSKIKDTLFHLNRSLKIVEIVENFGTEALAVYLAKEENDWVDEHNRELEERINLIRSSKGNLASLFE